MLLPSCAHHLAEQLLQMMDGRQAAALCSGRCSRDPQQWWQSPYPRDQGGNTSSTKRAVPRAGWKFVPTPLMSARVLLLASGSAGSGFY